MVELEAKERMNKSKNNIMRDWEEEQWSYMSGDLITDVGLEVKASWSPDVDSGHPRTV